MDLKYMTKEERIAKARRFLNDWPERRLSREKFDVYIIDNGFADDPGEIEDRNAPDFDPQKKKGFAGERSRAKRLLNSWADMLPPEESYQIVSAAGGTELFLVDWDEAAKEEAANLGNAVRASAEAQYRKAARLSKAAESQLMLATTPRAAEAAAVIKEKMKLAKVYVKLQSDQVNAVTLKFDKAWEKLEEEMTEVLMGIGHAEPDAEE